MFRNSRLTAHSPEEVPTAKPKAQRRSFRRRQRSFRRLSRVRTAMDYNSDDEESEYDLKTTMSRYSVNAKADSVDLELDNLSADRYGVLADGTSFFNLHSDSTESSIHAKWRSFDERDLTAMEDELKNEEDEERDWCEKPKKERQKTAEEIRDQPKKERRTAVDEIREGGIALADLDDERKRLKLGWFSLRAAGKTPVEQKAGELPSRPTKAKEQTKPKDKEQPQTDAKVLQIKVIPSQETKQEHGQSPHSDFASGFEEKKQSKASMRRSLRQSTKVSSKKTKAAAKAAGATAAVAVVAGASKKVDDTKPTDQGKEMTEEEAVLAGVLALHKHNDKKSIPNKEELEEETFDLDRLSELDEEEHFNTDTKLGALPRRNHCIGLANCVNPSCFMDDGSLPPNEDEDKEVAAGDLELDVDDYEEEDADKAAAKRRKKKLKEVLPFSTIEIPTCNTSRDAAADSEKWAPTANRVTSADQGTPTNQNSLQKASEQQEPVVTITKMKSKKSIFGRLRRKKR